MPAVGIVGAGLMGAGIAQVAAAHGWRVVLLDISTEVVDASIGKIDQSLSRLVEKKKLDPGEKEQIRQRLSRANGPADLGDCEVVIEAVAERLDIKVKALQAIESASGPGTIFASNTSSLSITEIGRGIGAGSRMVGMHFFNPVPLMPLVEIIRGKDTDPEVAQQVAGYAQAWGKTVVHAQDTPGFIVNRVARGYYLESLRILGEGLAPITEIDRTMREFSGFRMGPFELMDLVGIDVNYTVSQSVWEQLGRPARLQPHAIQASLFERGRLGRKSGEGFYRYGEAAPVPVVTVEAKPFTPSAEVRQEAGSFAEKAALRRGSEVEEYVFARVLAAILNEAALAQDEGVASRQDIDTAMKLGTNYPRGPFEWLAKIGVGACSRWLRALNAEVSDNRFAPAPFLHDRG